MILRIENEYELVAIQILHDNGEDYRFVLSGDELVDAMNCQIDIM